MSSIAPSITEITDVKANSMKIIWSKIEENGTITRYAVCYKASENVKDLDCNMNETINNNTTTVTTLENLYADTTYNVAVRAGTAEGFGNHGQIMSEKTLNGGKLYYCSNIR